MSAILYPSAQIERQIITPFDRVLKDEFEDGPAQARGLWTPQEYKHRIEVTTTPMTRAEWWRLRSFLNQRGTFDSFYFRDNLDRTGNYEVRLREIPGREFNVATMQARVMMEDVAPRRHLPELDEVETATGYTIDELRLWWDPNREFYALEDGAAVTEDETWDETFHDHRADWQASLPINLTGAEDAQYQSYRGTNEWALCSNYSHGATGNTPIISMFIIAKSPTAAAQQVLFAYGANATGDCLGFQISAANAFTPFDGDATTWGAASQSNGTPNTWRSFAVTATTSSNDVKFYCNGALLGTITRSRTQVAGNVSLLGMTDGTLICDQVDVAHAMIIKGELALANVKALHNLFAYQYGMVTVA